MARKRTSIEVSNKNAANICHLSIDDMHFESGKGRKFHLKRLRYVGVPTLRGNGTWRSKEAPVNAFRDVTIRNIFDCSKADQMAAFNATVIGSVIYFRYLDSKGFSGDYFDTKVMSECIRHYNSLAKKGVESTKAESIKKFLSFILKKMERNFDARSLPRVTKTILSSKNEAYDIELELKPIALLLRKSFHVFITHIKNGSHPELHPIFDAELFNERVINKKLSKAQAGQYRDAFRRAISVPAAYSAILEPKHNKEQAMFFTLVNQTGRVVLHLLFMLTGMNASVLASLTHSDIEFKDIGSGRYVLSGMKARANYKAVDNSAGFTKKTREIINSWLDISRFILKKLRVEKISDSPFIPYISLKGKVLDFTHNNSNPSVINNLVQKLVSFNINATRFRKTKSDILMRVTEDVFLVSQGLNNTVNIVAQSYSSGVKSNHENNLAAHYDAQASISKGESIERSVEAAKILHSDILNEYDYKVRLKNKGIPITTITPSGIRCQGASKGKLAKEARKSKNIGVSLEHDEKRCTDFLSCFDCKSHILIASETDIWLMLSFQAQVSDMKSVLASNSTPKNTLYRIEALLHKTLERLKEKSHEAFNNATQRLESEGYHPLYVNLHSLKFFLES